MKGKSGFTLIELAVALFLLAAFFLIAIPKFNDITEVNLKSSSRMLIARFRHLYNEAIFKNRVYRLSFDIERGEYWVDYLEGSQFVPSTNPSLDRQRLPSGVHFRDVITQRTHGRALGMREEFVLFFPTGFVEPAIMYLESENGSIYTLETIPYTGRLRVYDEYVDLVKR